MNHYDYLKENLVKFFEDVGVPQHLINTGLISAHGDKAYGYRSKWEKEGINFCHGVSIYLLTHTLPFTKEVRMIDGNWVDPGDWVINNKNKFLKYLPPVK